MRSLFPTCMAAVHLILALLLFEGWVGMLSAQNEHIRFNHLSLDDGLSQSSVLTMAQDPQGFIWIGTEDGLNRFDGYEFLIFKNEPRSPRSLSNNHIPVITVGNDGVLWAMSINVVLHRYNPETEDFDLFQLPLKPGEPWPILTCLVSDPAGFIWIGTRDSGVFRFDINRKAFKRYGSLPNENSTLSSQNIRDILIDRQDVLWAAGRDGLFRYQRDTDLFTKIPHAPGHRDSEWHINLSRLFEDHEGRLWLCTRDGLDVLSQDRKEWRSIPFAASETQPDGTLYIYDLTEDDKGQLWLATGHGVISFSLETETYQRFKHNPSSLDSLANDVVFSLLYDQSQTLWFGSLGLDFLDRGGEHFLHYMPEFGEPDSLRGTIVWSIQEDQAGNVWVATDEGINRMDRKTGISIYYPPGTSDASLYSGGAFVVKTSRDGTLWISSDGGITARDPVSGAVKKYTPDPDKAQAIPEPAVRILEDHSGSMWYCTSKGLYQLLDRNAGTFKGYRTDNEDPNTLSSDALVSIYEDQGGNLWVSAQNGLNQLSPDRTVITRYIHDPDRANTIGSSASSEMAEDLSGRLWVGSMGSGINILDKNRTAFTHLTETDGLPNGIINAILMDTKGLLWVSTNRGLSKIDPTDLNITNYALHNGLQSIEFNTGSACRSSKSGELYFGGVNGFNVFDPEKILPNPVPPRVVITHLRINNQLRQRAAIDPGSPLEKPANLTKNITLDYKQNILTLEFAALHYSYPNANQYAYALEGFQNDWTFVPASRRFVTFTNLPDGLFTLKIKAANKDGVWSDPETLLVIRMEPPPWRTWWAYLIYSLTIILALLTYRTYYRKKLKGERDLNEKLRQVDRMKDDFLANTSHELRTPLNGIIGIAESLLVGAAGEINEKLSANLSMIISSGRRLSNLVNDLLDFSKLKNSTLKMHRKPVDMRAMTDTIFSLCEPLVGSRDIRFVNAIPPDAPLVDGDEDRLQQIMFNLIGNAVKFTDAGHVKVRSTVVGSNLEIAVEDTGIGIPPSQFSKIFESFEQVDSSSTREAGGTGLGLAVARKLVELHGGHLTVQSQLDVGSVFTYTLPISGLPGMPAPKVEPTPVVLASSGRKEGFKPLNVVTNDENHARILVVDDEAVNRQVLINHLTLQNYSVTEATNGPEALKLLETGSYDLILLDVMMPRMSGYEVCLRVRDRHPIQDLPVIFLTARSQPKDLETGFASGGSDFLAKPISRDELISRVRTHLTLLDAHRNLVGNVEARTRELKVAYKTLEDMSLTDPLTGLRNRRFVLKNIEADVAQTNRAYLNWLESGKKDAPPHEQDLTFFVLDMDHFKSVNDTYGHAAGDEMLLKMRTLMEQAFRASDFLVRWGGEEFLVVARFSSRDMAGVMADRLCRLVENHPFDIGGGQHIHRSCSIGYASYPFIEQQPRLVSWSQVIDIADLALYAAKRTTRNTWVGFRETIETDRRELMRRLLADPGGEAEAGRIKVETGISAEIPIQWKQPTS